MRHLRFNTFITNNSDKYYNGYYLMLQKLPKKLTETIVRDNKKQLQKELRMTQYLHRNSEKKQYNIYMLTKEVITK